MTSAPSSEPTSGRRMQARPEADVGQALVRDRDGRRSCRAGRRRRHRVPASASCATVSALSFVTKPGPVSTGWPPPTVLALRLVEREEHDRQVALQVLLLVDGELDLAVLDRLHDVAAEVERAELGLEPAPWIASRAATAMSGLSVRTASIDVVGLELGLDLGERRLDVVDALDLEVLDVAAEALLGAVAALVEADVRLLVDDAEQLVRAGLLELRARALAGDRLGLADVRDRAEVLRSRPRPSSA